MQLKPNPTNGCFVCGGGNPRGMHLEFEQDDATQKIRGRFRLGAEYQGGEGFIHGGVIAMLMDEVMSKANRFRRARAVTAELKIDYLKPLKVNADLIIEGWEGRAEGRNLYMEAEIRDADGMVLAHGYGRFVNLALSRDPLGEHVATDATANPPTRAAR